MSTTTDTAQAAHAQDCRCRTCHERRVQQRLASPARRDPFAGLPVDDDEPM